MVAVPPPKASLINSNLGPYAIEALVGRGAMGAVYLARDRALHRKVALKVLLGSLARNQEAIRQFRLEAQAAAPLRHPNIVRIYEAGIREGTPFIAMEYIEGESLEQFLQRTPRLAWPQALHIASQVAAALACAHDAGIVHRDVKPANMLIDRSGRIRLTDFGIANREGLQEGSTPSALGTLEYMAPEQLTGETASPKSDLFALGVVLYRMLSGKAPYGGGSPEALVHAMIHGAPVPLRRIAPDLPDDVARLTMRLLEKTPANRPAHGREVIQTIERLQREEGGASALPEALDAFIREQSRARRIDTDIQDRSTTGRGAGRPQSGRKLLSARGLGAVLTAFACVVAVAWAGFPGHRSQAPESPLLDGDFVQFQGRGIALPLNGSPWQPSSLVWDEASSVLTCLLTSDTRDLNANREAALELGLDAREARFAGATSGPWQADAASGGSPEALVLYPYGGADGRRSSVYFSRWPDADRPSLDLYPRGAGRHGPESRPVLSIPEASLPMSVRLPGQAPPVAIHGPKRLAGAVLRDRRDGGLYVALVDLRQTNQVRDGRALTAPDASILPWPLQFSRDGESLYFFRHSGARERSLWRVSLASGAEAPVAVGAIDTATLSISPDDAWVALRTGSGEGDIAIYPVGGGQPIFAGPGTTGPGGWLPGGQGLVVSAMDADGKAQALRISLMGGVHRAYVTDFDEGIAGLPSVSPDGRQVAVAVAATIPRIELITLAGTEDRIAAATLGEHHAAGH